MDKVAILDKAIEDMTRKPHQLAEMAGCGSPDSPTSAGAKMLDGVRDGVAEMLDYCRDEFHDAAVAEDVQALDDNGRVAEIADGAPDVYNAGMWAMFLDLAAYHEDPSEIMGTIDDMAKAAAVCLYMIAERFAFALLEEVAEAYRDAIAEAEDADETGEDA